MAEAARRAPDIARPTWIMAKHQTAARGRRGRAWVVPEGNLSATLIFRPEATPAEAAKRSFLAANALYQALSIYVSADKLALKWPNDVLLYGGKVAGILLESAGRGPFVDWLSIGIGVNLQAHARRDDRRGFRPHQPASGRRRRGIARRIFLRPSPMPMPRKRPSWHALALTGSARIGCPTPRVWAR